MRAIESPALIDIDDSTIDVDLSFLFHFLSTYSLYFAKRLANRIVISNEPIDSRTERHELIDRSGEDFNLKLALLDFDKVSLVTETNRPERARYGKSRVVKTDRRNFRDERFSQTSIAGSQFSTDFR